MKTICRLIYKYKVWRCLKTGVTDKKILQLVLFSYKHRIYQYNGLCYHLFYVEFDLGCLIQQFIKFKGFSEPKHKGSYWWPIDDRKSRIKFLEDLIAKQD